MSLGIKGLLFPELCPTIRGKLSRKGKRKPPWRTELLGKVKSRRVMSKLAYWCCLLIGGGKMVVRELLWNMSEENYVSSELAERLYKFRWLSRIKWEQCLFIFLSEFGPVISIVLSHHLPKLKPQCDRECDWLTRHSNSLPVVLLLHSTDGRLDHGVCFGQGSVSRSNLCHVEAQVLSWSPKKRLPY